MTLPTDLIFPFEGNRLEAGNPQLLADYMRELTTTLSKMYQDMAQAINGDIKEWTPKIFGSLVAGSPIYTRQTGWCLRQGLLVDCWMDIEWTGHIGTGTAYIELPYIAKFVLDAPFSFKLLTETITLSAGYTDLFLAAAANTNQGYLFQSGSGKALAIVAPPTDGRILGHVRYIGKTLET